MPEIDLKEERHVLWYASDSLKIKVECLRKPTQQRGIPMRYTIKTSGLMCGHCDATVETALLNVAGVTDADADHETQTVQVECADCSAHTVYVEYNSEEEKQSAEQMVVRLWNIGKVVTSERGE